MNTDLLQRGKQIKLAVFDVDGVLTDGRLYSVSYTHLTLPTTERV